MSLLESSGTYSTGGDGSDVRISHLRQIPGLRSRDSRTHPKTRPIDAVLRYGHTGKIPWSTWLICCLRI